MTIQSCLFLAAIVLDWVLKAAGGGTSAVGCNEVSDPPVSSQMRNPLVFKPDTCWSECATNTWSGHFMLIWDLCIALLR